MTMAQMEAEILRAALYQILKECNAIKLSRRGIVKIIMAALDTNSASG